MKILDTLQNLVSGLGGAKDQAPGTSHVMTWLSPYEALAAYRGDWIARKVVDIPAMDSTRAWRNWQAADEEIEALETEEKRLGIKQKTLTAMIRARLFGGSAMILGTAQDPTTPLDLASIGVGGLQYVHVCGRYEITPGALQRDPMAPDYGEPVYYELNRVTTVNPYATDTPKAVGQAGMVTIHPTRVIRFIGNELPDPSLCGAGVNEAWGDSVLQALNDAVINAGITSQGIAGLVLQAKVDVFSIPNLTQNVGNAGYLERLIARFQAANTAKSLQNALILDSQEIWNQKTVNFSALPDILTLYLEIAAAAADIPSTRMLAKQSKGLGNSGEGDLKNYYDRIGSDQEMRLRPCLEKLDEPLIRSALGSRPKTVHWMFAPLWQMSETERAVIRKSDAETAAAYAASGLIPKGVLAAAVQNQIVEQSALPGLEAAIDALPDLPDGAVWTGVGKDELTGLLAAWQSGALTRDDVFAVLQRGCMIDPSVTAEAHAEQSENEAAPTAGIEGVTLDPVMGEPVAPPPTPPAAGKVVPIRQAANDATPRTLYVSRNVTNAAEILAWAKAQGFASTLPADDLHVTIAFSRTPVDWMSVGEMGGSGKVEIDPGGPRLVEKLGSAIVLLFASWSLSWRHTEIREAGASWDYDQYQPHISITYDPPADLDLTKVQAYQGRIVLGPEVFAEVDEDWKAGLVEA